MKEVVDEFKKFLLSGKTEEAMGLAGAFMDDNLSDYIDSLPT